MLLNQCLAISLSPVGLSGELKVEWQRGAEDGQEENEDDKDEGEGEERKEYEKRSRQDSAPKVTIAATGLSQSVAASLFRQLVERNSRFGEEQRQKTVDEEARCAVREALARVEFAGFVVPSWLLLSGSYTDLQCLKTSWSEGYFRSPVGFRIETIGNIRSVNVDYFGFGQNETKPQLEQVTNDNRITIKYTSQQAGHQNQHTTSDKKQQQAPSLILQSQLLSRLQRPDSDLNQNQDKNRAPKFASLNAAILDSVAELTNHERSRSGATSHIFGVHVGALIERLTSKYTNKIDLPQVEFIDCAINGLVRGTQLRLVPMTQEQMESALGDQRHRATATDVTQLYAMQSVFLDQLIVPGLKFDCSPSVATTTGEQSTERRVSRFSSASATKSKSTTLDSGIQSWDLLSRESYSLTSAIPFPAHHDEPQVHDHHQLNAMAATKNSADRHKSKRGFSLNRSFSFRPKKSARESGEQLGSADTWRLEVRPEASAGERVADNHHQQSSERKSSNLSCLFRSKSMRTISGGKGDRFRGLWKHQHQQQELELPDRQQNQQTTDRSGREINCDEFRRDISEPTNLWLGKTSQNEHQATIDYLATAQPHKRAFSIRGTSLLAFNTAKDDLAPSGGKIVLFLRKLFSSRRSQRTRIVSQSGAQKKCPHNIIKLGLSAAAAATTTTEQTGNGQAISTQAGRLLRTRTLVAPKIRLSSSVSTASSSSGSNSLIEILDCSAAVASSKRHLREEKARATLSQASWRLVKRSDSSLSQNSKASCSTTESTVSQQLRRHLDEAYKRHRNCTSQREKDFIDSIQVLRQASRHALQTSSKPTSRAGGGSTAKSASFKSSTSGDESASNSNNSSSRSSCADSSCSAAATTVRQPEMRQSCDCEWARTRARTSDICHDNLNQSYARLGLINQTEISTISSANYKQQQHLDLIQQQNEGASSAQLLSNNFVTKARDLGSLDCSQHRFKPERHSDNWTCSKEHEPMESQLNNCCICSSYLTPARICPLACTYPTSATLPCCLAIQQQHPQQVMSDVVQSMLPHTQLSDVADFCCPLWRSMVYTYCQPPNPFYSNLLTNSGLPLGQQEQPAAIDQLSRLENFSTSTSSNSTTSHHHQQQQRQQHNTTIDLKIEIGADFKKENGGSRCRLVVEPEDSLGPYDTIDELSLNSNNNPDNRDDVENDNEKLERDSCQSCNSKSPDSLQAKEATAFRTLLSDDSMHEKMQKLNCSKNRPKFRVPLISKAERTLFLSAPFTISYLLINIATLIAANQDQICHADDYTNDLPIFIEKRNICNYDSVPVSVYSISIIPETDETKLCLKGEFPDQTFLITKEKELKLVGRLEEAKTDVTLQIIRTANDIVGTPGERRQAINAIKFELTIEDCNQVSWQTIVVAILFSVCVILMSSLAIMLILYQQKGLIRSGNDEDRADEIQYSGDFRQDETFINPRRTSSYEFSATSKLSESTLERQHVEPVEQV